MFKPRLVLEYVINHLILFIMKNSIYLLLVLLSLSACKKDELENPMTLTSSFPSEFNVLKGLFNGDGVGAICNLDDDVLIVFDQRGEHYAWIEDNEVKAEYDIDESDSHFQSSQLSSVGAIMRWSYGRVYFFDEQGENYSLFDYDADDVKGSWNDEDFFSFASWSRETFEWGDNGQNPFDRIGAMWPNTIIGDQCQESQLSFGQNSWMVNEDGDEVCYYDSSGSFEDKDDTEDLEMINNCGGDNGSMPFERIAAACRYELPTTTLEVFFSDDGTQFSYYTVGEGVFSPIYDLY